MMKTLLQHAVRRLYVQGPNSWTGDFEHALDFKVAGRALQFAETWGLREVELVFVMENPPQVTNVPLERFAPRGDGSLKRKRDIGTTG